MFFASDNGAPAAPQVMAALLRANEGPAMPYGADPLTAAVRAHIRDVFEAPQAAVYLLGTGTAANALALSVLTPPFGAVFCHHAAHIQHDECGAPEFYTHGAKLIGVAGGDGRICPAALSQAFAALGVGNVHGVQPAALSLTNVTEAGTLYTPEEIRTLCALAKAHGLPVHLDGARFANAVVASGATPADLTWRAGVDIVSFGGTKGGLLGAEAVVIFDPAKAWEFELRRKRAGHLPSKYRYLAAQFEGWLEGDLWLDLARHANAMAHTLATGLAQIPQARVIHPCAANIVFAALPKVGHDRARAAGATFYTDATGPEAVPVTRLVTSWATTAQEVAQVIDLIAAP